MNKYLRAHIALFLVALIYGANFTIAKVVLDDGYIEPVGFILIRVLSGILFFTFIHHFFIKEKIESRDIGRLILCGLFGVAINQMFFFMGLKLTTPINGALIMTTTPIIVLVAGAIMLKESITTRKILGILIGASGAIVLILYGEELHFSKDRALGDLLIFINAASYAIYMVLAKSLLNKYHPITVVKWVFTFGGIFVLPFGAGQLWEVEWHTFTLSIWAAIAYVLICATFLTYLFNAYALKTVQASTVAIYIYLQPLLATLIAIIAGSDQLVSLKVISGVMIFVGVYLTSSRKSNFKV